MVMILATNNKEKLKEIKSILHEYEIYSLKDKNIDIDVVEDEDTFFGNALKKAKEIYKISKEPVIADDSGLCITALNDFPGVLTHRFLGEDATDEERNYDLIKRVKDLDDKSAKVVCNLVYYDGINTLVGEGILHGKITSQPRGENGFGFDPIFELENKKTLSEITREEKNILSARYLAAVDLANKIKQIKN
jgi:XTP/dITP diphosphohydrolase